MIDHVSFAVKNYQESIEFYDQTLTILGYERIMNIDLLEYNFKCAGYGKGDKPHFWVSSCGRNPQEEIGNAQGLHIAFIAPTTESIHKWYEKCLELGAKDNGAPGPRPEYHPGFYGAFVIDPNGWRIEAALHHYQGATERNYQF